MADDIDIEEHDVLEDPKLKMILPHIINIKSEPSEIEEEDECEEYLNMNIKTEPIEFESRPRINDNIIIFGSKTSAPMVHQTTSTCINKESINNLISYEDDYDDDDDDNDTDAVDIVSDDDIDEDDDEYEDDSDDINIIPSSVVLEDCQQLLVNNSCYCSECGTLFPSISASESHRMTSHSLLVAVSKNKALKSTTKSSLNDFNQMINSSRRRDLLCQHCNIYFPSENDLLNHEKLLLPHTEEAFIDEIPSEKHGNAVAFEKELLKDNMYLICTICSCVFKTGDNYMGHISLNHGNPNVTKVIAPFKPYCVHCKRKIKIPKEYNCHMRKLHAEIYLRRSFYKKKGQYDCHICGVVFPSADAELEHRKEKHPTSISQYDMKFRKRLIMGKHAKSIKSKSLTTEYNHYKKHVKSSDVSKSITAVLYNVRTITPNKILPNVKANILDEKILVPKTHLYKCNKCQIHFITSITAFEHTKRCTLSKGDWKCRSCRRSFKMVDKQMHILQHGLNERFKVIVIFENVLPRVLNRCGKCNVCFDESTFSKYHAYGCKPGPSVECDVCHLRIHKFALSRHLNAHTEHGLKLNDFIITDYLNISSSLSTDNNSELIGVEKGKKTRNVDFNRMYFCPNCKIYMSVRRTRDGHERGDCIKRKSAHELCKLCGLVFTKKGIISHKAYHKMFNLKLHNLRFINIINGNRIVPPFPAFKFCTNCQVHFVSQMAINSHDCDKREHKSCQFCKKKFSDLALKLHVPFHQFSHPTEEVTPAKRSSNYIGIGRKKLSKLTGVNKTVTETQSRVNSSIKDMIKKYKTMVTVWNILYRCTACDIVFDCYDSVVEHCQNHYCNMQNYNLSIEYCQDCNLKFADVCYHRHEEFHLQNSVTIESFVVIDCNYSLLLLDDWERVFDKLSKDRVQHVLSKSIYNEVRGVRMELLSDGDLGSIYKCSRCNVSVHIQSIVDHVKYGECSADGIRSTCDVCGVGFNNLNVANAHMLHHKQSGESYRIVSFNDPKNLFVDEALIKSAIVDLKFVRCHFCGKLISKSLYRHHIYKHNYKRKKKLLKQSQAFISKNSKIPSVKTKVPQTLLSKMDQKSVFRFHICTRCNVALVKYTTHICRDNIKRKICHKCQIFISSDASNVRRHNRLHQKYPMLSHKTVTITYFNSSRPSKKIKFYKCTNCTKCVTPKYYRSHKCSAKRIVKCDLCGLHFDSRGLNFHRHHHRLHNYSASDIAVVTFDNKTDAFISKTFPLLPASVKSKAIATSVKSKALVTNVKSKAMPANVKYKTIATKIKSKVIATNVKSKAIATDVISTDTDLDSDITSDTKIKILRVYKCTSCELLFCDRQNLLQHMLGTRGVCDNSAGVICEHCNLEFHQEEIESHHSLRFLPSCGVCEEKDLVIESTFLLKKSDSSNENNWLYYCKKCDMYNIRDKRTHFNTHHTIVPNKTLCVQCGVHFASTCINKHKLNHHDPNNDIPFLDLNVEFTVEYPLEVEDCSSTTSVTNIYRCTTCNLHFLHKSSLISHRKRNEHNAEKVLCTICDVPFTRKFIRSHEVMHEEHKEFSVIDCDENFENKSLQNSDNNTSFLDVNVEFTADRRLEQVADKATSVTNIYKCATCNLHFLYKSSLMSHRKRKEHNVKQVLCTICDLAFSRKSIRSHEAMHEQYKEFNVIDCEANFKNRSLQNSYNNTSFLDVNVEFTADRRLEKVPEKATSVIDIYRCVTCNLHFLHKSSLRTHRKNEEHFAEQVLCTLCDLPFTKKCIKKHKAMHESHKEFNVIDCQENSSNGSLLNSSSTSLNISEPLDTVPTTSECTVSTDQSIEVNSISKTSSSNQSSESSGRSSTMMGLSNSATRANKAEVKLFKCKPCDVYFLTAESCSYHAVDHSPLDTTEYIACKICDLQFLNRSLDEHMKGHREKTFDVDTLIVVEYRPNGHSVEIDTYSASERWKSKLVTTTTNSDDDTIHSTFFT